MRARLVNGTSGVPSRSACVRVRVPRRVNAQPASWTTGTDRAWTWTGSDEYSSLGDRVDAPPLPLPPIAGPTRVVVVRHGQSTWNAAGRVQGSTDLAVLTDKGQRQARDTAAMLSSESFDRVYASTLARAAETCDIVVRQSFRLFSIHEAIVAPRVCVRTRHAGMQTGRSGVGSQAFNKSDHHHTPCGMQVAAGRAGVPRLDTPLLREIDLYSFQVWAVWTVWTVLTRRRCVRLTCAASRCGPDTTGGSQWCFFDVFTMKFHTFHTP